MEHGALGSPLSKRLVALGIVGRDTLALAERELGASDAGLIAWLAEREEVDAARLSPTAPGMSTTLSSAGVCITGWSIPASNGRWPSSAGGRPE